MPYTPLETAFQCGGADVKLLCQLFDGDGLPQILGEGAAVPVWQSPPVPAGRPLFAYPPKGQVQEGNSWAFSCKYAWRAKGGPKTSRKNPFHFLPGG